MTRLVLRPLCFNWKSPACRFHIHSFTLRGSAGLGREFTLMRWGQDKIVAILQMTFQNWFFVCKLLYFNPTFTKIIPVCLLNKKSTLIQIMDWNRTVDDQSSKPMMVQFSYLYLGLDEVMCYYWSFLHYVFDIFIDILFFNIVANVNSTIGWQFRFH